MFKYCLTSYVIFASQLASADVVITALKPKAEGEVFPVVRVVNQPVVSEKINNTLQLGYLEHLPNAFQKHPFEQVRFDEKNCCGSTTFDGWQQYATPKNILSLSLSGESTGAYTSSYTTYENFDTRSGNPVLLAHIIQPDKRTALNALLVSKVREKITDFLTNAQRAETQSKETPAEIPVETQSAETYDADQRALYKECLTTLEDVSLDWFSFYAKSHSMVFVKGRCSNHAMRALDELGTFHIELPTQTVQPYLTAYGKNVLSDAAQQVSHHHLLGKQLTGQLGKSAVTFVLQEHYSDNSINASYWYHKYKQPIELNGTFANNQLTVSERYYDEKNQVWIKRGSIRAVWAHGKLTGTWRNAKTGQTYALHLAE